MKYILLFVTLLIFSGCTTHQLSLDDGNSEIEIKLSGAMQEAQVYINGDQVFDKKNVRLIKLQDLENGVYNIHVTGKADNRNGEIDYSQSITLTGGTYLIEIDSPPLTTQYYLLTGLTIIGSFALTQILL